MSDNQNSKNSSRLTFDKICKLDPKIKSLYDRAIAFRDDHESYDVMEVFYGYGKWFGKGFKKRVRELTGFERLDGHDDLRTPEAYDLLYDTIFDVLDGKR